MNGTTAPQAKDKTNASWHWDRHICRSGCLLNARRETTLPLPDRCRASAHLEPRTKGVPPQIRPASQHLRSRASEFATSHCAVRAVRPHAHAMHTDTYIYMVRRLAFPAPRPPQWYGLVGVGWGGVGAACAEWGWGGCAARRHREGRVGPGSYASPTNPVR